MNERGACRSERLLLKVRSEQTHMRCYSQQQDQESEGLSSLCVGAEFVKDAEDPLAIRTASYNIE